MSLCPLSVEFASSTGAMLFFTALNSMHGRTCSPWAARTLWPLVGVRSRGPFTEIVLLLPLFARGALTRCLYSSSAWTKLC